MRRQEYITWQALQNAKASFVVCGYRWIFPVMNQLVTRNGAAADEDHVILLPRFIHFHRPRRATLRMAGCEMRDHRDTAQLDSVAIAQDSVCRYGWIREPIAEVKIALASPREKVRVSLARHQFRAR